MVLNLSNQQSVMSGHTNGKVRYSVHVHSMAYANLNLQVPWQACLWL